MTVSVPRDLHAVLGTRLKVDLKTDSLSVANRLKLQAVAELQARIEHARETKSGRPKTVVREALKIAEFAARALDPVERSDVDAAIARRAGDILGPDVGSSGSCTDGGGKVPTFDPGRAALAEQFVAVASGEALPLALLHEDYLSRSRVKPRTRADDVRALRYLMTWCERERIPLTVQSISRPVAVRFSDALGPLCGGLAERTQNKYLGRLSRYWSFLLKRDKVAANPWAGLLLAVPRTKHDEEERAFTDEEVRRLLTGGAEPRLMDVMMVGALTGARLDAIVDLRVGDAVDGAFTFKPQKKERTSRDVPIHPALREIVERRSADRLPTDDLFPEWPAPKKEGSLRERSFKASNAFTKYRRACGVDQVVEGKRRALVNFHSFRRWFCTKAERTGHRAELVASIVGHRRTGMTFGRYSEGPEWKEARRCITKIKLPPLDGSSVAEDRVLTPRSRA